MNINTDGLSSRVLGGLITIALLGRVADINTESLATRYTPPTGSFGGKYKITQILLETDTNSSIYYGFPCMKLHLS